jgi:hypothetical protein
MKKRLLLSLMIVPLAIQANMYQKNLQVFTVNTAEKRCSSPLHLVYKGTKEGYAAEIAKHKDDIAMATLGGADFATKALAHGGGADAIVGGLVVGLGVFAIKGLADAITGDSEYLYVTECNSGSNKTRLMTLVVSNDKLSEAQWVQLAKKDQARSAR